MPAFPSRMLRFGLVYVAGAATAACGFGGATQRLASAITPYRVEVVQGNFVSKEQVEALKPGMNRQQVRDTLGTPLVASVFHADRWDYVFTLKRQGVEPQSRKLTVWFKGEVFERSEGDALPSEAEFVATLDSKRKQAKVPVLEASEEALGKYSSKPSVQPQADPAAAPVASYPPLEPPAR